MFCKTRFYFTRNTSMLHVLCRAKVNRPCVSPKFSPFSLSNIWTNLRLKRPYSSLVSSAIKTEIPVGISKSSSLKELPISSKSTSYWLLGTSGLVFGIVVLGGLTRLTESGLSITEWKPVTGAIPPLNEEEWEIEFAKYKDSPEFKQLNSHITLEEFKFIFSMEWGHRLVGRCIGMFFILPALYFWKTGKFSKHVTKRVVGLTALLGLQGVIGWWMVKSGLDVDQLAERNSKPTVSQYRLTTHLGAAFLMYLGVLWTAFEISSENLWLNTAKKSPKAALEIMEKLRNPALNRFRKLSTGLLVLTFLTAMSGGMVAGLDAGLIYNTFPHMGDDYIPSKTELMSPIFARKEDLSDMWWRNLLENPTTVQLVHRILAISTFVSVTAAHIIVRKNKAIVPRPARIMVNTAMGFATLQVALGISTLIYLVPIPLAAAHQAGALALLTTCLAFSARLRKPRPQTFDYINKIIKAQLIKPTI